MPVSLNVDMVYLLSKVRSLPTTLFFQFTLIQLQLPVTLQILQCSSAYKWKVFPSCEKKISTFLIESINWNYESHCSKLSCIKKCSSHFVLYKINFQKYIKSYYRTYDSFVNIITFELYNVTVELKLFTLPKELSISQRYHSSFLRLLNIQPLCRVASSDQYRNVYEATRNKNDTASQCTSNFLLW